MTLGAALGVSVFAAGATAPPAAIVGVFEAHGGGGDRDFRLQIDSLEASGLFRIRLRYLDYDRGLGPSAVGTAFLVDHDLVLLPAPTRDRRSVPAALHFDATFAHATWKRCPDPSTGFARPDVDFARAGPCQTDGLLRAERRHDSHWPTELAVDVLGRCARFPDGVRRVLGQVASGFLSPEFSLEAWLGAVASPDSGWVRACPGGMRVLDKIEAARAAAQGHSRRHFILGLICKPRREKGEDEEHAYKRLHDFPKGDTAEATWRRRLEGVRRILWDGCRLGRLGFATKREFVEALPQPWVVDEQFPIMGSATAPLLFTWLVDDGVPLRDARAAARAMAGVGKWQPKPFRGSERCSSTGEVCRARNAWLRMATRPLPLGRAASSGGAGR